LKKFAFIFVLAMFTISAVQAQSKPSWWERQMFKFPKSFSLDASTFSAWILVEGLSSENETTVDFIVEQKDGKKVTIMRFTILMIESLCKWVQESAKYIENAPPKIDIDGVSYPLITTKRIIYESWNNPFVKLEILRSTASPNFSLRIFDNTVETGAHIPVELNAAKKNDFIQWLKDVSELATKARFPSPPPPSSTPTRSSSSPELPKSASHLRGRGKQK
jgi:hypothetical protein